MRIVAALSLASLSGIAALQGAQDAASRGLQALEPVHVHETDSLFLSRPSHIVWAAGGHLFVTEGRAVLDIGPSGRIEHVFGRSGRGPGEFISATSMAMSGDTLLAVYDHAVKRVTFIDLPGWTLRQVSPLLSQWPPVIKFSGPDLLTTAWDFETNTSIARAVEGTGTLDERQGVIPSLGAQTRMMITGAFWNSTFAPVGDEIFAMYEVSNSLYRWKRGTRVAREVDLPVVRRRGVPPGLFESLFRDPASATPAKMFDRSAPVAIAPVSADVVAIVTMDITVDGETWSAIHHVTLYDHRRERACADLLVPASRVKVAFGKDPLPTVTLRGDTVALLEQAANPSGDPTWLLRRYRIDPSQCAWRPITR